MENFCYFKWISLDQVSCAYCLVCKTMIAWSYLIMSDDMSDYRN